MADNQNTDEARTKWNLVGWIGLDIKEEHKERFFVEWQRHHVLRGGSNKNWPKKAAPWCKTVLLQFVASTLFLVSCSGPIPNLTRKLGRKWFKYPEPIPWSRWCQSRPRESLQKNEATKRA